MFKSESADSFYKNVDILGLVGICTVLLSSFSSMQELLVLVLSEGGEVLADDKLFLGVCLLPDVFLYLKQVPALICIILGSNPTRAMELVSHILYSFPYLMHLFR